MLVQIVKIHYLFYQLWYFCVGFKIEDFLLRKTYRNWNTFKMHKTVYFI